MQQWVGSTKVMWCVLFLFGSEIVVAKDLGIVGRTYSILETDLVEFITGKLKTMESKGELSNLEESFKKRSQEQIERPSPVLGIAKTTKERSYILDSSIVASQNIYDHQGSLIHLKGTRINPLDQVSLSKPVLVIDGDDDEQVKWALQQEKEIGESKIVLIKGPVISLRQSLKKNVFFDQQGVLCKRFKIKHVPARIQQKGNTLLIEEMKASS